MEKESIKRSFNFSYLIFLVLLCLCFSHCSTSKKVYAKAPHEPEITNKTIDVKRTLPRRTTDSLQYLLEENNILKNHFVGFSLFDPNLKEDILSLNANRPFTPASNMKLYTLYASLNYLNDRITALEYLETGDSLIVRGTGDPSFLDPYQKDNDFVYEFLSASDKKLYIDLGTFRDKRYGTGWAWDDYPYYYQAEKTGFPIYANKFYIRKAVKDSFVSTQPKYFEQFISEVSDTISPSIVRDEHSNSIIINSQKLDRKLVSWDMPILSSPELLVSLLRDTLSSEVQLAKRTFDDIEFKKLKGIATDSLLQELMTVSDNFIAEQLLLLCSSEELGYMKTADIIKHITKELFADMPDTIRWVDGSGLSRYNLVTPNTNVWILKKLLQEWDLEKIKEFFPSGKGNDTLDDYFQYEKPWIFAKTGSLSNNFNLSGYLITRSDRILVFSFMNNHYMAKRSDVIKEMNNILSFVRDNY